MLLLNSSTFYRGGTLDHSFYRTVLSAFPLSTSTVNNVTNYLCQSHQNPPRSPDRKVDLATDITICAYFFTISKCKSSRRRQTNRRRKTFIGARDVRQITTRVTTHVSDWPAGCGAPPTTAFACRSLACRTEQGTCHTCPVWRRTPSHWARPLTSAEAHLFTIHSSSVSPIPPTVSTLSLSK